VKLMHVCSRFRSVMMADATLWRVLEIGAESSQGPEAAMEFLKRSAPFSVSLIHYYSGRGTTPALSSAFSRFYDSLLDERSRIRSLLFGGDLMESQWRLLKQPLPSLQSLHFVDPINYYIPNKMPAFISKHPTVSSFHMAHYTPHDLSGMHGLTELILGEGSAGGSGRRLLHVLGQLSSHLNILKIFGSIPFDDFPQDTENGMVDLPFLRVLIVAPGRRFHSAVNHSPCPLFHFLSIPIESEVLWDFHDGVFTEWPRTQNVKQLIPYAGTRLLWLKDNTIHYPSTSPDDSPRYMDVVKSKILERTPLIEELVYGIHSASRSGAESWLCCLVNDILPPNFRTISVLLYASQPSLLTWSQRLISDLLRISNQRITVRFSSNMGPLKHCE